MGRYCNNITQFNRHATCRSPSLALLLFRGYQRNGCSGTHICDPSTNIEAVHFGGGIYQNPPSPHKSLKGAVTYVHSLK
jgi:hypothetical protein